MCGLVAMVTKNRNGFSSINLDMFTTMLFVDTLRGPDSTGVYLVNNLGNVEIAKSAQNATDFIGEDAFKNMRVDAIRNGWAMVGHNRKATRGEINDKNAHPFWVDDKLVLVHNGSYCGDHKHLKDTEVDSEAIAYALAEGGDDIAGSLQKINAAYALIWYDVEKKTLRVIRNAQRPLFWMETSDAWYFASEVEFLDFAAKRNNVVPITGPSGFEVASLDSWVLNDDKSTELTTDDLDIVFKPPVVVGASPLDHWKGPPFNRALALGWGFGDSYGDSEVCDVNYYSPPLDDTTQALDEAEAKAIEETALAIKEAKEVKPIPAAPVPDWTEKYTFMEWMEAKKIYSTGHRVRVECRDYLKEDAGPEKIYLTGKTMDQWGLYVIFAVNKKLFDVVTAPGSDAQKQRKVEFMVTVDVCGWKPKNPDEEDTHKRKGIITLTGKEPKVVLVGNTSVQ